MDTLLDPELGHDDVEGLVEDVDDVRLSDDGAVSLGEVLEEEDGVSLIWQDKKE